MKSIDLDTMKKAWKNESSFEDKRLSEVDIERYLHRRSGNISRLFRKGLIFDIVLKGIVGMSLLGIAILFREVPGFVIVISFILLGIIWTIWFQGRMIGKIPEAEAPGESIRITLETRIRFYYQHYIKSLYVGALSNSLIILSGMLYYLYFKYGEIRPFTWDDYLVFSGAIIIGYALGAFAQIAQHNFQVKQLESCLEEIDEETFSVLTIQSQKNKNLRLILLALLAILCGLLVLAFLIFR
jgi:hypothetical protein